MLMVSAGPPFTGMFCTHLVVAVTCIMSVCSLIPRSPLQPSKRRVCFEANLYHALMLDQLHVLLCIPVHSTQLSLVKLSDQFILFTKSVHPVYAESWTTCLQLE